MILGASRKTIMVRQLSIALNPLPCKGKRLLAAMFVQIEKVIAQKSIDAPVQNGIHIAVFAARAMIFDQSVGL